MSFDQSKLDFYIKNGFNVLFRGKHGVGKTAMVKEAFEKNGLNWRYYSAATMDPWVDFVGIPKEKVDSATGESHIELVLPKGLRNDVEALFMDELNRAPKKVRNAVMELIQFKSINGVPFPNLKFVWAAINPDDEEESDTSYDVEALDPAQKDRFQIIVDIPYEPSKQFFSDKFGVAGLGAVEWWKGLPEEGQNLVSPRRLEYAIDMFNVGGDLRDVLPNAQVNIQQLRERLGSGSIKDRLKELYKADEKARKLAFSNINFVTGAMPLITQKDEYISAFIEHVPRDIVAQAISEDDGANTEVILINAPKEFISPILASMLSSGNLKRAVIQKIHEVADANSIDISSEMDFRNAVEEGLTRLTDKSGRYDTLHAVHSRFNRSSAPEVYETALELVSKVVYHSADSALDDSKNPFHQLPKHIIKNLNEVFKTNSTSTMKVWKENKDRWFPNTDAARISRIEKYLKNFEAK